MKKVVTAFCLVIAGLTGYAQAPQSSSNFAKNTLVHSIEFLKSQSAFSFEAQVEKDVISADNIKVTDFSKHQFSLVHQQAFIISAENAAGKKVHYFSGEKYTWIDYTNNIYAEIPLKAKNTADVPAIIESVYGYQIPFYDFIELNTSLENAVNFFYQGEVLIGTAYCHQIIVETESAQWQFFIDTSWQPLIHKLIVTDYSNDTEMRYEANFSDWKLNTTKMSPMSLDLLIPYNAQLIEIEKI